MFSQVEDNLPASQQRTFNSELLPTAPGSPKALNITNSNVTLAWSRNAPLDKSRSLTYTIEQISPDGNSQDNPAESGWQISLRQLAGNTATVTGLRPETSYIFVVRAENAYGISAPSSVSVPIRTLSSDDRVTVPEELESARNVLSGKVGVIIINVIFFDVR